jgi:hypothetical protein
MRRENAEQCNGDSPADTLAPMLDRCLKQIVRVCSTGA